MNKDGEEWKNGKQKKDIIAAFLDDESESRACHLHKYLIHTQMVLVGEAEYSGKHSRIEEAIHR